MPICAHLLLCSNLLSCKETISRSHVCVLCGTAQTDTNAITKVSMTTDKNGTGMAKLRLRYIVRGLGFLAKRFPSSADMNPGSWSTLNERILVEYFIWEEGREDGEALYPAADRPACLPTCPVAYAGQPFTVYLGTLGTF